MPTAIIGIGNIGKTVARQLATGGERLLLASRNTSEVTALEQELGQLATAASVTFAIKEADAVILALGFDTEKQVIADHHAELAGKIIIDPSNPITFDENGEMRRVLPEGVSSGSVIAELLPEGTHFVKAFGTLSAASLASAANRQPERVALFYVAGDEPATTAAERLISTAGFDPVRAGGLDAALRIEVFGDLHEYGGLNGQLLTGPEAQSALAAQAP